MAAVKCRAPIIAINCLTSFTWKTDMKMVCDSLKLLIYYILALQQGLLVVSLLGGRKVNNLSKYAVLLLIHSLGCYLCSYMLLCYYTNSY